MNTEALSLVGQGLVEKADAAMWRRAARSTPRTMRTRIPGCCRATRYTARMSSGLAGPARQPEAGGP